MNLHVLYYNEISKVEWDKRVRSISESTFYHSSTVIDYERILPNNLENNPFILINDNNKSVAVCSSVLRKNSELNINELSSRFPSNSIPATLLDLTPSERRKVMDKAYQSIYDYAIENDVKKIEMYRHPVNISSMNLNLIVSDYIFEPMKYNFLSTMYNTLLIDLSLNDSVLLGNMSKFHRKHIRKGREKDIKVKVYNKNSKISTLDEKFESYRLAHFKSAGKSTRPIETWNAMRDATKNGEATLFISYIEDIEISYLLCGEFYKVAYGWSQVNVEEFEREYSPRHLLEWEAIMYYKNIGFSFYEIGERFFNNQLKSYPSEKEFSISVFKERYGGIIYPKIKWFSYLDKNLLKQELENGMTSFLDTDDILFKGVKK